MSQTIPAHINLEEFARLSQELSAEELAKRYQRGARTIRYWKAILKNHTSFTVQAPQKGTLAFPEPLGKTYDDYITIDADRALILGDAEIPNHDPAIFDTACSIAKQFNIETLILNGDFVALDCFSTWARTAVYKLAFEEELDVAEEALKVFLQQFKQIVWVTGNHERRLAYRVDGHITIGKFLEKFSKGLTISEYAYCLLNSGGNTIMVVHPKNYSRIPLSTARELAAVKLTCIVAGHNHHQSFGYDRSGQHWIVDGGCCRDSSKTRYKSVECSTHPAWNEGFTMIIDGEPYLINKRNADFWKKVKID